MSVLFPFFLTVMSALFPCFLLSLSVTLSGFFGLSLAIPFPGIMSLLPQSLGGGSSGFVSCIDTQHVTHCNVRHCALVQSVINRRI